MPFAALPARLAEEERLRHPGRRSLLLLPFVALLALLIAAGVATPQITHNYDGGVAIAPQRGISLAF